MYEFKVGGILVDKFREGEFNRNRRVKIYRSKDDRIDMVVYADQHHLRANGFVLPPPPGVNVVDVYRAGESDAWVVWQDSRGRYLAAKVPLLASRGFTPDGKRRHLPSRPVKGELASSMELPDTWGKDSPGVDGNTAGSRAGQQYPAGNGFPGSSGVAPASAAGDGSAAAPSGGAQEPPPIDEPGNPYGIDPIMSADEIRTLAASVFASEKKGGDKGMSLDDWGVGVGGKAGIRHVGGIDDCLDSTDALLKFYPAVRAAVERAAAEKRSKEEARRQALLDQYRSGGHGAGSGSGDQGTGRPPGDPGGVTGGSLSEEEPSGYGASSAPRPSDPGR